MGGFWVEEDFVIFEGVEKVPRPPLRLTFRQPFLLKHLIQSDALLQAGRNSQHFTEITSLLLLLPGLLQKLSW